MAIPLKQRVGYIDWMRGLACLLMFQTHCYDSWLSPAARNSQFFRWSQLVGTLPAPLFLFLAGISFALVTKRLREKGVSANEIASTTIRRGAGIFGLGLLFRVQEFALGYPCSPWADLLRVDILNVIGVSMMLMGMACRLAKKQPASGIVAGAGAAGIALLTPPVWNWRPRWLPWPVESYVNGVHNLGVPQHWLFPIFPWTAFAFAGLAVGFFLLSDWARAHEAKVIAGLGMFGAFCLALGWWFDSLPAKLYALHDFWHTSPNFFLMRVGALLMIVPASYAWRRWGAGQVGFKWGLSPLMKMGQASLLVYWVHIEFVYGRFSILLKHGEGVLAATLGLLMIFVAMSVLATARLYTKGRGREILERVREKLRRQMPPSAVQS